MKKKLLLFILLAVVGVAGYAFLSPMEDMALNMSFTEEVIIKDGNIENEKTIMPFTLENDDTYVIRTEWKAGKPGMVTGLSIKNEASENVYTIIGDSVQSETVEMELSAGKYEAQYVFFANTEDLDRYLEDTNNKSVNKEYTFALNETYEIEYNLKVVNIKSFEYRLGLLLGILIVLFFGAILVTVVLKFPTTDGNLKEQFDERQLQARGNGFKYGFFTQLFYNCVLICISDFELPFENSLLLIIGILLAVFVWVLYCIHKEAYVSLNTNATKLTIVFIIIGIVNLVVGIRHICEGNIIVNGVVTFSCVNLICAIMLIATAIVMNVHAKRSELEKDETED